METTALSAMPAVPERLDEKTLETYRRLGFLQADLDPMHRLPPETLPLFEGADPATADWARRRYCGTVGVELLHIHDPERRAWLQQRMESEPGPGDQGRIFDHLLRADTFEQMLQQRYLGTKRFSIEGVDALIPLLDEMLEACADHRTRQVVLAMSHRGRLNVMTHTVGKPAAEIFAGFEDVDPRSILGGGDVKYHMGATGEHRGKNGHAVSIHLVSNPSHLEAVDPVAVGRVRAMLDYTGQRVKDASPGTPVEILGLSGVPEAGTRFEVLDHERIARDRAQQAEEKLRRQELAQGGSRRSLEELLGQGGMATVWRAEDGVLGRTVASKVTLFAFGNAFLAYKLEELDRRLLRCLAQTFEGRPVGLGTLADEICCAQATESVFTMPRARTA